MLNYLLLVLYAGVVLSDVEKRPNFVVILTDDQDVVLGGMTPMKNVHQFIAKEGVTFTNSYVTSPICCPSRASLLTGLYIHNHHTHNNSLHGNCYGQEWRENEHRVFANALQDSGYNTFYAGKYMNQYGVKEAGGPEVVPRGWSEWHGLVGNSVYYNYTMSNNGVPTHSTDLYLTDVIRDLSISYIENQTESRPFLMVLAPPAPHQPFTPARRHEGAYSNVTAVRHPNFNVAVHDKHWLLRMPPSPLPESMMPELDRVYRSRWEALLAVDEMVADVIGALEVNALLDNTYVIYTSDNGYHIAPLDRVYRSRWEALLAVDEMVADVIGALEVNALLDNTYVIYTSDNGYHIGQFSQVYDKRQPYEADIKVPLVIRGPGLKKNAQNPQPVLNIDIAPTILHLAGVKAPEMDGRPVKMEKEEVDERYMLVEYYGEGRDGSVDPNCPWKYDSDNLAQCYPEYDCKCQDAKNNTFACLRHIAKRLNMKYCIFADSELTTPTKKVRRKVGRKRIKKKRRYRLKKQRSFKNSHWKFAELYDLAADPYELENSVDDEFQAIIVWYNNYLSQMLKCKGAKNCDDPLGESVQ